MLAQGKPTRMVSSPSKQILTRKQLLRLQEQLLKLLQAALMVLISGLLETWLENSSPSSLTMNSRPLFED